MGFHGGDRKSESRCHGVTLKDIGLNKKQSERYQRIAGIPEEAFEVYLGGRGRFLDAFMLLKFFK